MNWAYLVIPDLLLPDDVAAEACAGLHLFALEEMFARSHREAIPKAGLETLLCEIFGMQNAASAPIAPISARFDGLGEGCWMRADPVHLRLQRDQLIMFPQVGVSAGEAAQMCMSLNEHFAGQGVEFFAPHPQRWYVRLGRLPGIETAPMSQAIGRDVRGLLPKGAEALYWHQLFNEVQMLLFSHPVNEAREARGELPINSVWLWGSGCDTLLPQRTFDHVSSDDPLAEMFAAAADIPFSGWSGQWSEEKASGRQLLVWTGLRSALQRGDLEEWRASLQNFEAGYAEPLRRALRSGSIGQVTLDAIDSSGILRLSLTRGSAWAFWRRSRPLADWSMR